MRGRGLKQGGGALPEGYTRSPLMRCIFRSNWTPFPVETGQPFRFKVDSDSGSNWTQSERSMNASLKVIHLRAVC